MGKVRIDGGAEDVSGHGLSSLRNVITGPHDCSSLVIVELLIVRAACERVDLPKTHYAAIVVEQPHTIVSVGWC